MRGMTVAEEGEEEGVTVVAVVRTRKDRFHTNLRPCRRASRASREKTNWTSSAAVSSSFHSIAQRKC